MKIQGLVKNKVLPRTKTIVEENDIDKLTIGGGIRELEEYVDNLMRKKNNTLETLFGGVKNQTNRNIDSNNNRTLFTKEAIQAARMASGFNQKREDEYDR